MEITQEDIIKNYREVNAEQDYKIRILEAENQRLKNELDKQIKDNRKLVKALKMYADGDFYKTDVILHTNPLTNREEVFSVDIIDNKGNIIYTKAKDVLKKIGEEE